MRRFIFVILLLLFSFGCHKENHSPEVQAAINHFIENKEIAGIVSILSDPDYNLTIDCFGYANAENKRLLTPTPSLPSSP